MSGANGKVSNDQRYTPSHPCPICGSHDRARRGQGERCHGYLAGSGKFAFCARVESDETIESAAGTLFKHRLEGDQPAPPPRSPARPRKGYGTPQEAAKRLGRGLGRIAGHWPYHDAGGRACMAVYRFEAADGAKTYRPVHRNGSDLWYVGDPEGPLPLYQLPTLASADLVLVCEGEKAADAARSLGLVATTPAHGAESPKRSDWSSLAGKTVCILPDNDPPGRKFALVVAELLAKLDPTPMVKVLDLPGLPEKGDIVEWIAGGGTAEHLLNLIEAAEEIELPRTSSGRNGKPPADPPEVNGHPAPAPAGPPTWRLDVRKASQYRIRPLKFLSKPRLPRGIVITLGGAGGEGKSTLTEQIAADLSRNRPTLGSDVPYGEPVDVLMLACEDGREDALVPRLIAAGADIDRIEIIEGLKNDKGDQLPFDITYLLYLRQHIEAGNAAGRNYKLVIIDPITTYVGRAKIDDHRDAQLKPALEGLSRIAQDLDVTFICLAHLNKSGGGKSAAFRIMGGAAYVTSSRLAYIYAADPDDAGRRILASPKANIPGGKPPSLAVRIQSIAQAEAMAMLAPHVDHLSEEDRVELAGQLYRLTYDGTSERTAEEVLDDGLGTKGDRKEKALDFLREILDEGRFVASNTVYAEGKKRGISRSAIWDAKSELNITPCKVTDNGITAWFWKLDNPDETPF